MSVADRGARSEVRCPMSDARCPATRRIHDFVDDGVGDQNGGSNTLDQIEPDDAGKENDW